MKTKLSSVATDSIDDLPYRQYLIAMIASGHKDCETNSNGWSIERWADYCIKKADAIIEQLDSENK